jgi:glycosyltransferase involved in cell wall biosynthesis
VDVSVIIPVFNGGKTIRDCLEALKKQSFKGKIEIIVVDDGSKDSTREIVSEIKGVRLLKQEHKGPAVARNHGAKEAKGEIIIFTDADCIADSNMIEELVKPFKANKYVIGVQGSYRTKQEELEAKFVQLEIEERYELMKKSQFIDFMGTYCCAYQKKTFLKEKGFDESFPKASGEDPELSYRIAKKGGRLVFKPQAFCFHTHPDTLKKYLKVKFFRAFYRVRLYRKHKEKIMKDSYTPQTLKVQIGLAGLLTLSTLVWIIFPGLYILFAVAFILFLLSTAPLTWFILRKNSLVGVAVPGLIFLRSMAFLFGLAFGLAKGI